MTGDGSEQIAVEAFRLGVKDYLDKPFTVDEMLQAIDKALREQRLAAEQDRLNRNLLTAEAVRITVVTLSHYLNNRLMVLDNGLTLLEEELLQKTSDPTSLKILQDCYNSALGIQAVLQVLRNTTKVELTPYTPTTPMINIQAALQDALDKLPLKR